MRLATAFLILVSVAPGSMARTLHAGSAVRVRLLDTAEVDSESISLASLVPTTARATLRQSAASINLGSSPLPGTWRVFERASIEHSLRTAPELRSRLEIPERVIVSRGYRLLSPEEIYGAIASALKQKGFKDAELPRMDDVGIAVPVFVTKSDPGLLVQRIAFDPAREVTQFRLWPSKERKALPFSVAVRLKAELPVLVAKRGLHQGETASESDFQWEPSKHAVDLAKPQTAPVRLAGLVARRDIASGEPVSGQMFQPRTDAKPGRLATMVIEGEGFRILTTVMPLQPGARGQRIRVRSLDTQRIVWAEIVAPDYLRQMETKR